MLNALLDKYGHRFDFVIYAGGVGGEFICNTISNLSSDYSNNSTIGDDNNSWSYYDSIFKNFWLFIAKRSTNYNLITLEEEFKNRYTKDEQLQITAQVIKEFNGDPEKRLLLRMHRPLSNMEILFPNSKIILIYPKDIEYYIYSKVNLMMKKHCIILSDRQARNEIHMYSYCNNDICLDADKIMSKFNDESVIYNHALQLILTNSPELSAGLSKINTEEYFWVVYVKDDMDKVDYYFDRKHRKQLIEINNKDYYCVSDIMHSNIISDIFNINALEFNKAINLWHTSNIKLIKEIEKKYNIFLISQYGF